MIANAELGIRDVTTSPTVEEYVKEHDCSKVWVCPHLVSNGRIGNPTYLGGVECTSSTIPEPVKSKKVRKVFKQDGFLCIIWQNDEDPGWDSEIDK